MQNKGGLPKESETCRQMDELSTVDMMFYVPAKKRNNFLADSQRLLQLARQGHVRLRQLAGWIDSADPAVAQDARTANERDADAAEN